MSEQTTFLLVDDDVSILSLMKRVLDMKFPGSRILSAETGDEGLELARNNDPDVMVLDINLPGGINGFEVCKLLKGDPATSHIPVVMVSGDRIESASRAYGLELGADGYLYKPYSLEEFVAQMRVMLRIKQTEDLLRSQKDRLEKAFNLQTEELKQSKEALEHKVDELENILRKQTEEMIRADRLASAGIMSAGLAHEVNNPNTFISSNLQTFKMFWNELEEVCNSLSVGLTEEQRQKIMFIKEEMPSLVKGIEEGSQRISAIVNGMKSYTAESSEKQRRIDMAQVIESACRLVGNQLKPSVTIKVDLPAAMPPVLGSEQLLIQTFVNLFLNAANALKENLKIGLITVTGEHTDEEIKITVADNGPGINQEHINELFSPFFTTRRDAGGSGLGLFVSHGIIKGHNGRIDVTSSSDGARFTIVLPRLTEE
ncbi:MAG: response regulator [Lentisphaerae bacterium]|nr:response regulator [Lentisphaerota bacterium]